MTAPKVPGVGAALDQDTLGIVRQRLCDDSGFVPSPLVVSVLRQGKENRASVREHLRPMGLFALADADEAFRHSPIGGDTENPTATAPAGNQDACGPPRCSTHSHILQAGNRRYRPATDRDAFQRWA